MLYKTHFAISDEIAKMVVSRTLRNEDIQMTLNAARRASDKVGTLKRKLWAKDPWAGMGAGPGALWGRGVSGFFSFTVCSEKVTTAIFYTTTTCVFYQFIDQLFQSCSAYLKIIMYMNKLPTLPRSNGSHNVYNNDNTTHKEQ